MSDSSKQRQKCGRRAAMRALLGVWAGGIASQLAAHDQVPGAPQTSPVVVQGGTVHVVDGPVLRGGSVLFDEGRIVEVGQRVKVPDDAEVIEANDSHVYPGLIESLTDLGLREISAVGMTVDRNEYGRENSNARAWVAVNPDSELIPVTRAGGVLIANVAPGGRWLRGQSAVMQLDGWTAGEMNLRAPSALFVDWDAMRPRASDEKARAREKEQKLREFDELLDSARRYAEARQARPETTPSDIRLESLQPLLDGSLPLLVEADRRESIESAVAYARSRGLKLVIYGGYDAESCAGLLKRYDVPVIVAATYRLPRRRHDPYDAPYTLPQRLREAGVTFAIAGEGQGGPGGAAAARNLPYHAATAVAYGLPREEAIRAITLSAAEILGVSDSVGSLTAGKDATLIVSDGDILETESNVTHAWIQGRRVDLSSKHTMLYDKYRQKYRRRR